MCVENCPDGYWGDYDNHLCVQFCPFTASDPHYADNSTGNCELLCTNDTYGTNGTTEDPAPSCEYECPEGSFGRDSDKICVADCEAGLYGDPITRRCYSDPMNCSDGYYANSVSHLCVLPEDCQTVGTHYYADNDTKECIEECAEPYYGDSALWLCVETCPEDYFGENTTRLCLDNCASHSSLAEDQNNLCVARCSDEPVRHFGDWTTHTCVKPLDCSVDSNGDQTYARNASQEC